MQKQFEVRHCERADIPAIKQIYQQTANYANTLQLPYPSLDNWEAFLGDKPDNFYSLVAQHEEEVVGQLGMEVFKGPRRKHVASIGMPVLQQQQGKGVDRHLVEAAIELAENWLAIKRIELEVYTDNLAAIALYQKYKFTIEGTAHKYAFRNGEYVDVLLMARITAPSPVKLAI